MIASGGVDGWKMDLHFLFLAFAINVGARMVLFDIPGTGESAIPLSRESAEVINGLVAYARELGNGRVAHLGISMGGYFSAITGLSGTVDAAVVLGGPVEEAFAEGRSFEFGMADIVGNALGFNAGRPPRRSPGDATRWASGRCSTPTRTRRCWLSTAPRTSTAPARHARLRRPARHTRRTAPGNRALRGDQARRSSPNHVQLAEPNTHG